MLIELRLAVRAAVDLTKTVIATRESIRKRIAGLRLMQADMLCSLFRYVCTHVVRGAFTHNGCSFISLRDFKRDDQKIGGKMLPGRLESASCRSVEVIVLSDYALVLCDNIKNDVKRLGNFMENYASENWLGRVHLIRVEHLLNPLFS